MNSYDLAQMAAGELAETERIAQKWMRHEQDRDQAVVETAAALKEANVLSQNALAAIEEMEARLETDRQQRAASEKAARRREMATIIIAVLTLIATIWGTLSHGTTRESPRQQQTEYQQASAWPPQ